MTKKGGGKPFSKNKNTHNKQNPKTNVKKKRTLKNNRAKVMEKHAAFEKAAHDPYMREGMEKESIFTKKKDKGKIAKIVKSPYERFNPLIYRFEGNPSELSLPKPIMSLSKKVTHSTKLGDLYPRVLQRSSLVPGASIGGKNKRKRRTNKKTRKRRTRKKRKTLRRKRRR